MATNSKDSECTSLLVWKCWQPLQFEPVIPNVGGTTPHVGLFNFKGAFYWKGGGDKG